VDRRQLLCRLVGLGAASVGLVLAGCGAFQSAAQADKKLPRIGFLWLNSPGPGSAIFQAIDDGLSEHGYVNGKNIVVVHRSAEEGRLDLLPTRAAELVSLDVQAIVVGSGPTLEAAFAATQGIPIVSADAIVILQPNVQRYIDSLARPGGNVTGLTAGTPGNIWGKRLELLKEGAPHVSRVTFLADDSIVLDHPLRGGGPMWTDFATSAEALELEVRVLNAPTLDDLEAAFGSVAWEARDGLYAAPSAAFYVPRARVIAQAAKFRLPTIYPRTEYALDGGFMVYGTHVPDYFQRAMYYVRRVLTGTRAADLPLEAPSRYHFVLNLKTAAAIGHTFPQATLQQATELIRRTLASAAAKSCKSTR
jgi:putative ABC transport system substrate-binding protein